MKGNLPKIIILIVMLFLAYKSLSKGINAFRARPASVAPVEEAPVESAPSEEQLPLEQAASPETVTKTNADILSAMNDYGRVPFVSVQEPKKGTESQSSEQETGSYGKTTPSIPQLTTIINYQGEWSAVVNGNLVKTGDKMGKLTILEIKENLVRVEEAGKTYDLKLWQEGITR